MNRPAIGMETHSHAPAESSRDRDGATAIGISRKHERGFYVAVMILPDGRVSAGSVPTGGQRQRARLTTGAHVTSRRSTTR